MRGRQQEAYPDFDLFVRAISTHRIQHDPTCDHLHHGPHSRHICAVLPRFLNGDVDLPVNTRKGQGILDLCQSRRAVKLRAQWLLRPAARPYRGL